MKWMLVSTPPAVTMSFVGGRSHDHQLPPRSERHAVHEVGIARLADVVDAISLDPDVGLDDPQRGVEDDGVGDDAIEGEGGGDGGHLSHSLAEGLAPAEFALVAVVGEVGFDAEEEGGVSEAEAVAGGGAVGVGVGGAGDEPRGTEVLREGGVAEDDSVGGLFSLHAGFDFVPAVGMGRSVGEAVAADDVAIASDVDEGDRFGFSRFESDGGAGGDVETPSQGELAVEQQGGVGFQKGVVGSHLDGAVARVGHGDFDQVGRPGRVAAAVVVIVGSGVDFDGGQRGRHQDLTRNEGLVLVFLPAFPLFLPTKNAQLRHGQETPLQRQGQIPVLPPDRIVHRQQLRPVGKRRLHLHLSHHGRHSGQDLIPSQESRAHGHEVRHGALPAKDDGGVAPAEARGLPVPDHLHHLHGDEGLRFGDVEFQSPRQAVLGQAPGVVEEEVVGFAGGQVEETAGKKGGAGVGVRAGMRVRTWAERRARGREEGAAGAKEGGGGGTGDANHGATSEAW
mmetsp:Transcript_11918/g.25924  ORF Transcript_11918/g.25924 Transcript_11918/m.25924 type:complete len:507 (-) Transcript_11918:121-1641(-)